MINIDTNANSEPSASPDIAELLEPVLPPTFYDRLGVLPKARRLGQMVRDLLESAR